jgi:hypothetical protein
MANSRNSTLPDPPSGDTPNSCSMKYMTVSWFPTRSEPHLTHDGFHHVLRHSAMSLMIDVS